MQLNKTGWIKNRGGAWGAGREATSCSPTLSPPGKKRWGCGVGGAVMQGQGQGEPGADLFTVSRKRPEEAGRSGSCL